MLVSALPLDSKGLRVFCHDDMNYCIVRCFWGGVCFSLLPALVALGRTLVLFLLFLIPSLSLCHIAWGVSFVVK